MAGMIAIPEGATLIAVWSLSLERGDVRRLARLLLRCGCPCAAVFAVTISDRGVDVDLCPEGLTDARHYQAHGDSAEIIVAEYGGTLRSVRVDSADPLKIAKALAGFDGVFENVRGCTLDEVMKGGRRVG